MKTKGFPPEQVGYQLSPGYFSAFAGRALRDIVDPLGRVYGPNPYDIPQWKWRILYFAAEFIMTMIDTHHIKAGSEGLLHDKEELRGLRSSLRRILNGVGMKDDITKEKSSSPWDSEIVLLKPSLIRRRGRLLPDENLWSSYFGAIYFNHSKLKLAEGNRLVVVVTVSQLLYRSSSERTITKWTLAFDATDGSAAEILKEAIKPSSKCKVKCYEVPAKLLKRPEFYDNQTPQFIRFQKEDVPHLAAV